jgi:hypothetical protein
MILIGSPAWVFSCHIPRQESAGQLGASPTVRATQPELFPEFN